MPASTGPTPDWGQVTLRYAGVRLDGQPVTGDLILTYNATTPLLDEDPFLPVSIYPVELKKTLTTATIVVKDENGADVNRTVGYAEWNVPASDDPDIQGFGGTYTLKENLTNATGQTRNFVASKDAANGIIWLNRITSVNAVPGQAISAVSVAEFNQLKAQVAAGGGGSGGGSYSGVPVDGSVTNAKVASGAAISLDKTVSGSTNKAYTATEQTRLANIAAGATANSTDAFLLNRGNHQGQSTLANAISDAQEAVEDIVGAMVQRSGGTYDDPNGKITIGGVANTLDTMPTGYTHNISLNTAKAAASRAQITTRTDIRIVVVGGGALSEWTSPWLQDSWDKWELVPNA